MVWPDGYTVISPGYNDSFLTKQIYVTKSITGYARNITESSTTLMAEVITHLPAKVSIELGNTTSYGIRKEIESEFVSNIYHTDGRTNISANIETLQPETTYHFRVITENADGIFAGEDKTFKTANTLKMTDGSGYTYNSITIGDRIWINSPLRTSRFMNGDSIPLIVDVNEWYETKSPSYYNFYADSMPEHFHKDNGLTYNFYALSDPRRLCPAGWHVADSSDWENMLSVINSPGNEGKFIINPYSAELCYIKGEISNSTGFSEYFSPVRFADGTEYFECKERYYWWSSTPGYLNTAIYYYIDPTSLAVRTGFSSRNAAYSARCVKDN